MKAYKPRFTNTSLSIRYALMSLCLSAVCRSVIFDHLAHLISYDRMSMLIILFNVISVGAMSIFSVFADKVNNKHTGVRLSVFFVILGFFLPPSFGINLKIVLLGLGSALFYSFASSLILSRSNGKSGWIGLLIGAQSIGLSCAVYSGLYAYLLAPLLMILAVPSDKCQNNDCTEEKTAKKTAFSLLPLVFLIFSYLLLSFEFSSFRFEWNFTYKTQFQLLIAIGLGRSVGGFVCDRIGRIMTVAASVSSGTVLICFCADRKWLSLLGLLLLSMSLAPMLTSVARLFPKKPAFSFALMSGTAYLGQVFAHFSKLNGILMLLISAMIIAVTVAAELPFSRKTPESEEVINEDN
ncbi:MAG: hypothetical protein IJ404_01745 [Clostridia bacterium]|nr:hypothetical protein [Clostridia bacterium]